MWNYRGYGRSKGVPSFTRLKRDGELMIDFLYTQKEVKRLGIHGESLGGAIACHLAKNRLVEFLFVDRSFSSLGDIAKFNFNKIVYWIFKAFHWDRTCVSSDYCSVECYKILSSDPQDTMINDLASLKNGVAIKCI